MQLLEITEPQNSIKNEDNSKVTAIGIDLGTTNSLAAYSKGQLPHIIPNESGVDILPSIVCSDENGSLSIGMQADMDYIKSVKRLIGKSYSEVVNNPQLPFYLKDTLTEDDGVLKIKLNNKLFTPEEISSQILLKLKVTAEQYFGYNIDKAVITVPAYFDDIERNATIFAARLAGIEVLRLISEPTAAAYAYGLDKGSEGYFLVYDLGGGTFDVSLLNMQMGVFQVIATSGNTMLGGDDIDHILYDYITRQINIIYGIKEFDSQTSKVILKQAKAAKEAFAKQNEVTIEFKYQEQHLLITIGLSIFEELIKPLIKETINIIHQTIEHSDVKNDEIEGVILVGGSSRINLIKHELKSHLNLKIFDDVDPDRVVALGAALQAENLTHGSDNLLLDVTPLSLGLELMGGIVDKVILRNTPIPCTIRKEFTTYADNQIGMQFHVVQGDREVASACRSLAHFELFGIPPMKAGAPKIEVSFTLDADGILFISATEQTTGTSQKVTLKPSYGLSMDKMHEMLVDAFSNAETDHEYKLLQETIVEAKRIIEVLETSLQANYNILDKDEYNLIKEHILFTRGKISENNRQNILDSIEKLEKLSSSFISRVMSIDMTKALKGTKV
jgi:molecular chaperone HscA